MFLKCLNFHLNIKKEESKNKRNPKNYRPAEKPKKLNKKIRINPKILEPFRMVVKIRKKTETHVRVSAMPIFAIVMSNK
jgi:hypothetical protein